MISGDLSVTCVTFPQPRGFEAVSDPLHIGLCNGSEVGAKWRNEAVVTDVTDKSVESGSSGEMYREKLFSKSDFR